jgi:hypothetical protein
MQRNCVNSILIFSLLTLSGAQPALANLSFVVSGSQPVGVTPVDLAGAPLGNGGVGGTGLYTVGDETFFLGGSPSGQGFVRGNSSGQYAAPDLVPLNMPTQGTYLSTGVGSDLLTFSTLQKSFTLLWGSVDTFNTLTFLDANPNTPKVLGTVVAGGTISGSSVISAAGLVAGSQTADGSTYITVSGGTFNQIEFSSTSPSFESLNFSSEAVSPEPTLLMALGGGLLGLAGVGILRRRKVSSI